MKEKLLINEYSCISDSGKQYIIQEYQELSDNTHTLKHLVTSDGLDVNYIDSETFKIVNTNEVVRKV
jgi:hypothetical protein